ncbi:hypothetical protein [Peptostreptococcus equinus]|uniref:Uncharacterized protein n=1 Tax=Peptostreptococcus equinus TaxID=3003601 RepID=A0ABY7JRG7_9FIRM|nr:hypothetical protein [Peptostreptococcus sp. CBA3647]WAW14643.1 hypothetical protein O0R46_08570 [Peptostreptococcus sp. CBA3647]
MVDLTEYAKENKQLEDKHNDLLIKSSVFFAIAFIFEVLLILVIVGVI